MIVLVLVIVGVGSALTSRRRIRRMAELRLIGMWLVWVAVGIQIVLFEIADGHLPDVLADGLHIASYVLCLGFLWQNRQLPGMILVTFGAGANFAAIAANGGTMPADAGAWERAGRAPADAADNSQVVESAHLAFLGDVFAIPAGWPLANVFSIGDVLIVAGSTYLAHRWCASVPAERLELSLTAT